jgi:hypothetical protein
MSTHRWIPGFENRYDVSADGEIRSWVKGSRWGARARTEPLVLGGYEPVKITREDGREVRVLGIEAAAYAYGGDLGETWRDVPGFSGRYQVSDKGGLRSLVTGTGERTFPYYLTPKPDKDGYLVLGLREGKRRIWFRICRLVLAAFVGPQPDGHEASHLDGTKRDHLTNLRWEPRPVNNRRRRDHGTMPRGEGHPHHKLTAANVRELRADPAPDLDAYASRWGVCSLTIRYAYTRRTWAHLEDL